MAAGQSDGGAEELVALGADGYLGALERRAGDASVLDGASPLELPLVLAPQVVLLPGGTLPMREHPAHPRWAMLDALLRGAGDALLAVAHELPRPGEVCCVARIERAARHTGDQAALVAVARGVARAAVLSVRGGGDGAPVAVLRLLLEATDRPLQPPALSAHAGAVWRSHRPEALAARLRSAPALLAVADAAVLASLSPAELSWHAAARLPLDARERHALLQEASAAVRLHRLLAAVGEDAVLCCASCGARWADGKHVLTTGATGAFVNPHGYVHDMLTVHRAGNLVTYGAPTAQDSWFPGHAWQIAHCRSCLEHAGWRFTAVPQAAQLPHLPAAFWGLRQGAFTHAARADARLN